MHKTQSLINRSLITDKIHSKSLSNFVLLNQKREIQENYQWKPLKIKETLVERNTTLNKKISFGGSYSHKKSILLTLNQFQQGKSTQDQSKKNRPSNAKQIDTNTLLKSKLKLSSKEQTQISSLQLFQDQKQHKQKMFFKRNKFTNTTIFFNQKVQDNIQTFKTVRCIEKQTPPQQILRKSLLQKIKTASKQNQRVIGIITIRRYGLRIRIKHGFASICLCNKKVHQNQHKLKNNHKINSLVQEMLLIKKSQEDSIYYFHLNKDPLASTNELPISQAAILASIHPNISIDSDYHFKVYEEEEKIRKIIKQIQDQIGVNFQQHSCISTKTLSPSGQKFSIDQNDQTPKYDWQLIQDASGYIEKMVQNPEIGKVRNKKIPKQDSLLHGIQKFYNEKFGTVNKLQTEQNFKNPLLEDHSHFHSELKEKNILNVISSRLQQEDFIMNKHIFKRPSIETLIQLNKRQRKAQLLELKHPNIIKRNIVNTLKTKKAVLRQLDEKHTLLSLQNIPYLMDKYGISRYEIHNLFTIYKTLQKISAMKFHFKNKIKKVADKGIDRQTFDQGMKRLDINPGDQVIKNICYFDDFISWEQFIKIVSIGLRKTPEERLQAILIGIGGTNNGQLSKNQISIIIGNSLNKIFDSQQAELKDYFTEVAMKDLDNDCSGTVDVNKIKKKCKQFSVNTGKEENTDLVTFLLLNS